MPDTVPPPPEPEPQPAVVLTREPFMAHMKGGLTYQSAASYKRTWSDGHVDYECVVCGEGFASPRSLGGHRQIHIRAGEVEPNWKDQVRETVRGHDPDHVITPQEHPAEPDVSAPDTAEPEVDHEDVQRLLQESFDLLGSYVQAVLAENAQLKAENTKLRSDWNGLQALITSIAGGTT